MCALGVVFYHMGLAWCTGGLLGVTVLFVLSGYLATAGLLSELARTGTIRLGSYWMRRVKRLLPTCVVFVAITAAVCTVANRQLLTKMRPDVVPALLMALNWTKIFGHESYFAAAGAPSPLTHFWSLALEFQFYLAWPPILMLLMRAIPQGGGPRWHGRRGVVVALAVLTLASAALMAALYVPGADPSRAYYGTDTRAQSLLLGCILAFVWPFGEKSQATAVAAAPWRRLALELAGLGSVAALVVMMATTEGYTSFSYYGGILLCSVIAAVEVAALVPAGTVVSRVMSWRPLAWVGSRSFAIYVWHYPVVELMQPRNSTTALAPWQVALELGVIIAAAELSYRLVEEPLRKGSLRSYLAALAQPILPAAFVRAASARAESGAGRRGHVAAALGATRRVPRAAVPVLVCVVAAWGLAFAPPVAAVGGEPDAHRVSAATLRKPLAAGKYDVLLIGDSVTLGARDAKATARAWAGYAKAGTAGDVVAIDPDDSAPLDAKAVARMIAAVEGSGDGSKGEKDASGSGADASGQADRVIYLVTCRSTAPYCEANNQVLRKAAKAGKSVRLIDWYAASAGHDEYFKSDGVTLTKSGRKAYARLVSAAVEKGTAADGSAKSA